jgi:hypothetical protein
MYHEGSKADWKETVDLSYALNEYVDGSPLLDVVSTIKEKFRQRPAIDEDALELIFIAFEEAAEMDDVDLFEEAMDELYNWADYNGVWLNTVQ